MARLERDIETSANNPGAVRDEDAWSEIAARVRSYSMAVADKEGISPDEAEDVVQDVLVKLQSLALIRRLKAMSSPVGYLVVTTRNVLRDAQRRQRTDSQTIARLGLDDLLIEAERGALADQARQERETALRQALRKLSRDERYLLKLRFWSDQSIGDIAKHLNVRHSTAAVRLFRLLRRLKDDLS